MAFSSCTSQMWLLYVTVTSHRNETVKDENSETLMTSESNSIRLLKDFAVLKTSQLQASTEKETDVKNTVTHEK